MVVVMLKQRKNTNKTTNPLTFSSSDVIRLNTSKCFDDDGRSNRTGSVWTASAYIITAVIGSGVLSLAWAIAQLGWIAGPTVMLLFSLVTYYTAALLADCYRSGDPVAGKRNYTCMDVVHSNIGGLKVKMCGLIQYLNLFGTAIGYTIAASISMIYPILWWLSIVAAVMSFTYSSIGLGLGIAKVAGLSANGTFKGSLTGISIGTVSPAQKIWGSFQALGNIAFAYSYSMILIEIQDTIKSPPSEAKTMKKATLLSIAVTTAFYMLCGCMGYAAFGDLAPGNLITGFGFFNPFWLLDIANAAIVIHLVGAYQVYCQLLFAFVEKWAAEKWSGSEFITKEIKIPIPGSRSYNLNLFRLVWRMIFVIVCTVLTVKFASFGTPSGTCRSFTVGDCHDPSSISVLEKVCLNKNECTVELTKENFNKGLCPGTIKKLTVEVVYS